MDLNLSLVLLLINCIIGKKVSSKKRNANMLIPLELLMLKFLIEKELVIYIKSSIFKKNIIV